MDVFHWQDHQFITLIDEATRFKISDVIPGQEADQLMESILRLWIHMFGPMGNLVLDQQTSLMKHNMLAQNVDDLASQEDPEVPPLDKEQVNTLVLVWSKDTLVCRSYACTNFMLNSLDKVFSPTWQEKRPWHRTRP